jgi:hypothetical protein
MALACVLSRTLTSQVAPLLPLCSNCALTRTKTAVFAATDTEYPPLASVVVVPSTVDAEFSTSTTAPRMGLAVVAA